ncbi:kinase-like domain-containing protein [Trametes gibbosa]|nr:kinase-like domain-containing protein [Trametes gibbosa]KAI0828265.1 kinase-like domain-containing protein [Trametes gibbosa]
MNVVAEHLSKKFIGAVEDEWQLYSNNSSDYSIGPPIGFGASSIVYAAHFQPPDAGALIPCALKVLDLDRLPPSALRLLQNETQLMSLSKHPNVLRVRGTWVDGHKLYIAMRLMNAGSVADVMRYAWTGGLEEDVIRCILRQALEGINYLHINGLIHRDVKAANLLIDDDGTVLLGDLGTTSPIFRPSVLGKRKSFVGTPCWMAPEIINGKRYDASADIWSFGITAIELAHGRAPRSRMDPHKVLVMTVTDAPPTLERNAGPHRYSSAFADVVAMCLHKDPARRPTAEVILQTPFFRNARKPSYLCSTILKGLPPLTQRQERRKQPSLLTHATMDSWDFSSSLPSSPTTSVYSRPQRPKSAIPPGSVFDIDLGAVGGSSTNPNCADDLDDAELDGRSRAEAYVVRIRERQQNTPPRSGAHARSRSGSSQSHSVPMSRHHTIESITEVVLPASVDAESEPGIELDPEVEGIPVVGPPNRFDPATLHVPLAVVPSTSPSGSSRSSVSAISSSSSPGPSTPPSSFVGNAKSQPVRLWKKLAGKFDFDSSKDVKDAAPIVPQPAAPTPTLKKAFGSVLARTGSRTVSNSKPPRS